MCYTYAHTTVLYIDNTQVSRLNIQLDGRPAEQIIQILSICCTCHLILVHKVSYICVKLYMLYIYIYLYIYRHNFTGWTPRRADHPTSFHMLYILFHSST